VWLALSKLRGQSIVGKNNRRNLKVYSVSVIIINHNTAVLTAQAVRSFYGGHARQKNFEVIVVDNASTTADRARLRQLVKRLPVNFTLLQSEKNLGFGGGNNWAARQATGQLLFFLNSDTIVTQNVLTPLQDFLAMTEQAAVVAPQLLSKNGQPQPHAYGTFPTLASLVRSHLLAGANLVFPTQEKIAAAATNVDWVSGGALMVRTSLFWQVGGFTSDYFMYFEDLDLCKKLQLAGYKIYVLPDSSLIHLGGQSVRLRGERRRLYFQSQDIFFRKFYTSMTAFLVRLLRRLI
jgi:GT2 family glycosyltransferase